MKIRTTQPKNNKYYIRQANGGLNGAVRGYPTISGANVLCNCVGYANGRFNEIINDPDLEGAVKPFKYQLVCNAENFIESAKRQGLKISATPIQGGIMVWQKGATLGGGDGAGHVAVVEEVYDDGTILTSESGYGAWAFKTIRRSNSNGRWGQNSYYKFRGCIINPSVKDAKVVPAPKLSVDGIGGEATVRAMQKFLGTPQDGIISGQKKSLNKYYPSLKAVEYGTKGSICIKYLQKWLGVTQDGIIGQATVKAWQKKIHVTADGIFGTASMKAWQKYLNENEKAVYPTKGKMIAQTAKGYCGSKSKEKASYKADAQAVYGKGNDTYCHRFVGVVLRMCGYPKMDYSGKTATAWKKIDAYLEANFNRVTGTPQEGDIHRTRSKAGNNHIFIELGGGKKAEANSKKKYYPHTANTTKGAKNWLYRAR